MEQKRDCGVVDSEIFKYGCSKEAIGVYAIITAFNGDINARQLLKTYDYSKKDEEETKEICMRALWELYDCGFIKLKVDGRKENGKKKNVQSRRN